MLAEVKALLGIGSDAEDAVLQIMIEDARSAVRDYCNRKDCPEQLDYVVRELVITSFLSNNEGNVASVKRGDTQISYANPITAAAFSEKQRAVLARYKKIRLE